MFSSEKVFMAWPSRLIFGAGERTRLPLLLKKLGYQSALVVTDRFFTTGSNVIAELVADLASAGIRSTVFDGSEPNPSVRLCVDVVKWVTENAGRHLHAPNELVHPLRLGRVGDLRRLDLGADQEQEERNEHPRADRAVGSRHRCGRRKQY